MPQLPGKIALVTGGASGLGAAIARRFAAEGATVILTDVQEEAGRKLATEIGGEFLPHDVTDESRWGEVIAEVEGRHGALHVLVNNAGIEGPFDATNPETARLTDWQAISRVNVEGVFLGCKAAIPLMTKSGGGSIINMSSIAALGANPDGMAYGASKAAVRHMTRSVAVHCARSGYRIRCNSVHPGMILTPMLRRISAHLGALRGITTEEMIEDFRSHIPQGEFQEPEDIADAVLFLASDAAKRITGTQLVVDGGSTISQQN